MSNDTQELMEAIEELSQIVMKANGDWVADFTDNYAKCIIAYDHHQGELTFSKHFLDEPLSFLPPCSIDAFYKVKEQAPRELLDKIWVSIYEKKVD